MTRRVLATALLLAAVCLPAAGCHRKADPSAEKVVTVYMYSEYIDPKLPEEFEQETGIKVKLDVYETTEEMLATLERAPRQYDVVVVSDHAISVMAKKGMIRPLDMKQIPNAANVADKFVNPPYDPEGKYSLPYQWGTVGLAYRTDKLPNMEPTWAMILDPARQPGPVVLMDSMRDMMAAALAYKGCDINSTDPGQLKEAADAILAAKGGQVTAFDGGVAALNKVQAGQALIGMVYNGDAVRLEDPHVGYLLPREGAVIWVDAMTIPADAPHVANAHKWINFLLDAKAGAQLSNFIRYASPNKASLPMIHASDRENPAIYPGPEQMKKLEYLRDVGADTRLYDEVWTRIKAQ
ncbi:MAG: Spermidine/putrescine-binding periplasmic protein [Phycisphaerae bacterium]|nr:Spermidine/putrescine-binding periplasmic protein [Phycisphaerae bacterium]